MARFSAYALLLILWATSAAGGDPDRVDPSASENLDLRNQIERLLERVEESRFSAERRKLRVEALSLAKELAILHPGVDRQSQVCELSLLTEDFRVVAVCEEADRLAEASDGTTRFLLGKAYVLAERWQDAETALLEVLELLDEDEARRPVYMFLGWVYERTLRIDEAMAAYAKGGSPHNLRRATGGEGKVPDKFGVARWAEILEPLRAQLGQLFDQIQESEDLTRRRALYAEAIPLAEEVARFDPGADSQRQVCEMCLGANDIKAVAACEKAMLLAKPSHAGRTGFLLANAYGLAERWQDAETVLLEAIELTDEVEKKQQFYRFLGFIYEKTKRHDEAIAAYEQGGNPTHVDRLKENLKTSAYSHDFGDLREGQEVKEEPDAPASAGDPDQIESSASETLDLRNQLERLRERISENRVPTRRRALYAEALPLAEELARLDPGADSQRQLCETSIGANGAKVVTACEEAMLLAKAPDIGRTRYLLAQAYSLAKRWQDVEAVALEAIELQDEAEMKPWLYKLLGFSYEKTERYDEAIAAYEQADAPESVRRVKENLEMSEFSADLEVPLEKIQELKEELESRKSASGGG